MGPPGSGPAGPHCSVMLWGPQCGQRATQGAQAAKMSEIVHGAAGQCYCPRRGGAGLSPGPGSQVPDEKGWRFPQTCSQDLPGLWSPTSQSQVLGQSCGASNGSLTQPCPALDRRMHAWTRCQGLEHLLAPSPWEAWRRVRRRGRRGPCEDTLAAGGQEGGSVCWVGQAWGWGLRPEQEGQGGLCWRVGQ